MGTVVTVQIGALQAYAFNLHGLCVWREAEGASPDAKLAVAWSIQNRVNARTWFGSSLVHVILKKFQYSSFSAGNPRSLLFPDEAEVAWQECVAAVEAVWEKSQPDPTDGADSYYSTDIAPPDWAKPEQFKAQIGPFRFYRTVP